VHGIFSAATFKVAELTFSQLADILSFIPQHSHNQGTLKNSMQLMRSSLFCPGNFYKLFKTT